MHPQLESWERAASQTDPRDGVIPHKQAGLAASNAGQRVAELNREANALRQYLAEACMEVRRLQRDYDRWRAIGDNSFGGIPIAQILADLLAWEVILNDNPQLRAIIEVGTWKGGFSIWLHAQTHARHMRFRTFDVVEPPHTAAVSGFRLVDVFANPEKVSHAIRIFGEPLLVFCDGGNKPRELELFAPMLQSPGSLILVHDWGTETNPEDVPEILEPVYADVLAGLDSITRAFRIKS